MKKVNFILLCLATLLATACATDKHAQVNHPQKMVDAVTVKYPESKNTLIFIEAPDGFVAPGIANNAIENGIDNADVVAITSALALKTTIVIVAGNDETITATTLAQVFKTGKDKINGSKVILVGAKGAQKTLSDLAITSGVALEFIDNVN